MTSCELKNEMPHCKTPEHVAAAKVKMTGLKDKVKFLQMKANAVENASDEVVTAQGKLLDLYNEDLRDYYQKMRGLFSYGIATGKTNPDCKLLFDGLGDYLEAKSESDRTAAQKAVNLCLTHGNLDSTDREPVADDRILTQFEAITDPEDQSRFYAKHKQEIMAAFQAREQQTLTFSHYLSMKAPTPEPVTKFCERCDTPEARGKWLGIARLTQIPDVGWPQRSECQKSVIAEEKSAGERIVSEYRAMENQAENNDVGLARLRISKGECGAFEQERIREKIRGMTEERFNARSPGLTNCARKPLS